MLGPGPLLGVLIFEGWRGPKKCTFGSHKQLWLQGAWGHFPPKILSPSFTPKITTHVLKLDKILRFQHQSGKNSKFMHTSRTFCYFLAPLKLSLWCWCRHWLKVDLFTPFCSKEWTFWTWSCHKNLISTPFVIKSGLFGWFGVCCALSPSTGLVRSFFIIFLKKELKLQYDMIKGMSRMLGILVWKLPV